MTTLKQSASVRGTVISNNDPDMVITLDSHPGVQISSIQDDSITYSFTGEVTEDTLYSLNLTFAYKGMYRTSIPLQLTHKVIPVELNAEWITTSADLVGASSNHVTLKLTDAKGQPATGVTLKTIKATSVPNNPGVCAGYSNLIMETDPGTYWVNINVGHLVGTIKIDLVLIHNEIEFIIPTESYTTPGTPVKARIDKDKFHSNDPSTTVNLFLTQDKYAMEDAPLDVAVYELTFTGGATTNTAVPFDLDTSAPINITPNGNVEDIHISGKIREKQIDGGGFIRDFGLDVPVEEPLPVLNVTRTSGGQAVVDQDHKLIFNVTLNGGGNAANVKLDRTHTTLPDSMVIISEEAASAFQYEVTVRSNAVLNEQATFRFLRNGSPVDGIEGSDWVDVTVIMNVVEGIDSITWSDAVILPSQRNNVTFLLKDKNGVGIQGVTASSVVITTDPQTGVVVNPPNIITPAAGPTGTYSIAVDRTHIGGDVGFSIDFMLNGVKFRFPPQVYTSPAAAIKAVFDPTTFTAGRPTAESIVGTFTQDRLNAPNTLLNGTISKLTYDEHVRSDDVTPITLTNGKATITLFGVSAGTSTLVGEISEVDGSNVSTVLGGFEAAFTVEAAPEVFEVTLDPELSEMNVGNQSTIIFKPTLDGVGIARDVFIDESPSSAPSNAVIISRKAISDTEYEVVIEGQSVGMSSAVFVFVRNGHTFEGGTSGKDFIDANFYVIVNEATGFTVDFEPVQTATLNVYKGYNFYPKFNGLPNGNEVSFDRTRSQFGTQNTVLNTGMISKEQMQAVVKYGTTGTLNASVLLVRSGFDYTSEEGVGKFTCNYQIKVSSAGRSIDIIGMPQGIAGYTGREVPIRFKLAIDGTDIDTTDPDLVYTFNSDWIEFVSANADGIIVRIVRVPTDEYELTNVTLTVTRGDAEGLDEFKLIAQSAKPKPAINVTGSITGVLNDTGKLPITVTSNGEDISQYATAFVVEENDYVSVDINGYWTIKKQDSTAVTISPRFGFDVYHDDVKWHYSTTVTFNIQAAVEEEPVITNPVERMSLQLWDPVVISYDIMYGSENINASVTSVVIDNLSEVQEWVEVLKGEDGRWYMKAIKADETNNTTINPRVIINLTYNGKDYNLPLTFEARIRPRAGQPVNRFDVQFV